jgi:enamine deaminase RidA (YjgF/YER057c/UK114 family)
MPQDSVIARPTPPDIYDTRPRGFVQVAVARPGVTIITSGMVGYDRDWKLTGDGGFEAQLRQVAVNLRAALASAGASPADVMNLRIFVVDLNDEKMGVFGRVMSEAFYDPSPEQRPTSTLVGVQRLARPELLVEIEALAVVP